MWIPDQHSDAENLRWAWLRAIEWGKWPLFLSQPIVPVLLYLYSWPWVIGSLVLVTFLWWLIIAPWTTPATGIDSAVFFVWFKALSAPAMAYLTWTRGEQWMALFVLVSPFVVTWAVGYVLLFPRAVLLHFFPSLKASQIGAVQQRLMESLGYDRIEAIGYVRRNAA